MRRRPRRHLSTALAALNLSEGMRRQLGAGVGDSDVNQRKAHQADVARQVSPGERERTSTVTAHIV